MTENDLFHNEESALRAAINLHAQDDASPAEFRGALGSLIGQFRRLIRETRRLILHSDRQERELTALNAKLQQLAAELQHKATHDDLTKALNRGAVIDRVVACLGDGALSLIVLDIDHFKRINDEHGHPAGDAVIVELVGRLRAILPAHAEIGRVGGEEFTVILPKVDIATAAELAEHMRKQVAEYPFPIPAGRTVTASFGVSFTTSGGTFDEAYGKADGALYEAKHGGRNTVVVSTPAERKAS